MNKLKLTTRKPNKEGWYWLQKNGYSPQIVRIIRYYDTKKLFYSVDLSQDVLIEDLKKEKWAEIPECYE